MMAYFGKNDMAAALTIFLPTSAFECTNRFRSRDRRKLGHQRLTSTSRTSTVSCIWLAALVSRQPTIASRMLAMASCSVLPWEIHPGMEGHSTTKVPVSSRSTVTSNFIQNNSTCDSLIRQLSYSFKVTADVFGKMIQDTKVFLIPTGTDSLVLNRSWVEFSESKPIADNKMPNLNKSVSRKVNGHWRGRRIPS